MKIVEYGHIKPKIVKCNHCGAVLEYVPKDLKLKSGLLCYLECPVCKTNIYTDNDGDYFIVSDLK